MNEHFIEDIITQKKTCYFISPHFDDMIFSSGALATKLRKTNTVIVINIFTQAGEQHTLSAKAYLKQCGYHDAAKLYTDRASEDKTAISPITDQVIDLGFQEALWRKRPGKLSRMLGKILPEFGSIYPTYRFNIAKGRIAKADRPTVAAIEAKLKELITTDNAAIFCPMGIGNHIDHVITHDICERLFAHPVYWADYPYTQKSDKPLGTGNDISFAENMEEKATLIAEYKTQYEAMFGKSGLILEPERFYLG
jgi:LmbE family N-acetylglucosaminyl deacetylase